MSDANSDLREYTKAKQTLADLLQQLHAATRVEGEDQDDSDRCRILLAKLAEDRFTIAVVGQFNRGKSTLLNALLGKAILPTGTLPVTSVVTSVTYGAAERLVIKKRSAQLPRVVPLERISDYVTETGNPGNRQQIEEAIVETALPLARRGVSFVDTPGIGSAQSANSATTYGFLPAVDAVIFVTSVESPMSGPEIDLLREALRFSREFFFVINKFDLLDHSDQSEKDRLIAWVKDQAKRLCGTEPRAYPVSSLHALQAAQTSGSDTQGSGLQSLVKDVERFLSERGKQALLSSVCMKAVRLASEIASRALVSARIVEMTREGKQRALETLRRSMEEAEQNVEIALTDVRNRLLSHVSVVEKRMGAMTSVWHSFLAGIAGNLDREAGSSPVAKRSYEAWQDRLLSELAAHQTVWLDDILRETNADLMAAVEPAMATIAEEVARLDEEAAAIARKGSAIDETPREQVQMPDLTAFRVAPASLGARVPQMLELAPGVVRNWLALRSLRRRFDVIIQASHERVISSCKASLSILADTIARDVRRLLRRKARALSAPSARGGSPVTDIPYSRLATIKEQMEALSESLLSGGIPVQSTPSEDGVPSLLAWATIHRSTSLSLEAARKSRCPVCTAQADAQFALFAEWQFLLSRDGRFREAFVLQGGFCPLHTWQFEQISSPQTLSHGFAPLLESLAVKLERATTLDLAGARELVETLVHREGDCPVCAFLRQEEEKAIQRFFADLAAKHQGAALETDFGICLPHLVAATAHIGDDSNRRLLLRHQIRKLEETADNMRSYAVKRESLRRELINDSEENAWNKALRRIVGERNLHMSAEVERLL